jgi:Ca2+-binding RTX toxin-like protein
MRTVSRISLVLAVAAAPLMTLTPLAQAAPIDCSYTKSKKMVTLTIDNTESTGWLVIEREIGTTRIGYTAEGDSWKGCEGARTTTTNKVKVMGSSLSEDIYIDLGNGPFAPGATPEKTGRSEIEFQLDLGSGTDRVTLVGSRGPDRLAFVSPTKAKLNGDADVDITMSGVDRWAMYGEEGSDVLDGSGVPSVRIWGGPGSDRLIGGEGPDDLYGDDNGGPGGDDVLTGNGGDDDLYGYLGNDILKAGDGNDYLAGHEGKDLLNGGAGDDYLATMDNKDGPDELIGGPGYDTADYSGRTANLKISLDGKANDGAKGEGDNVSPSIERVNGGDGNDTLIGNDAPNDLNGGGGKDILKGLGGNDDLDGDEGDDVLYGGTGNEYFGSEAGEDKFFGGEGNDTMWAGSSPDGRDVYSGGPGYDRIDYSGRSAALLIDVTDPGGDGDVGTGENDNVYPDFEWLSGGAASDTIRGSNRGEYLSGGGGPGSDTINGRGGPDTIYGNDGNDHLIGGEGFDYLYGGNGDDIIEAEDQGEDYVDCGSGASDTLSSVDAFDSHVNCEVLPI